MSPIRRTGSFLAVALSLCGCGAEAVGPTARIELTPALLCEGAESTAVIVSARRSMASDGTSDGLRYAWSFSRQPEDVVRGDVEKPEIVVQFSTVAPVRVHLEVTDDQGRATRGQLLGLTRAARVPCGAGCASHEICAPFAGVDLCVDDVECVEDEECGCLDCRADDSGTGRCVAP